MLDFLDNISNILPFEINQKQTSCIIAEAVVLICIISRLNLKTPEDVWIRHRGNPPLRPFA